MMAAAVRAIGAGPNTTTMCFMSANGAHVVAETNYAGEGHNGDSVAYRGQSRAGWARCRLANKGVLSRSTVTAASYRWKHCPSTIWARVMRAVRVSLTALPAVARATCSPFQRRYVSAAHACPYVEVHVIRWHELSGHRIVTAAVSGFRHT